MNADRFKYKEIILSFYKKRSVIIGVDPRPSDYKQANIPISAIQSANRSRKNMVTSHQ